MRTLHVLTVAILGACSAAPAPPSGPPMPSARGSTPESGFDAEPVPPAACMVRWYYTTYDITIDCTTAFAGGSASHYVTSCAVPAFVDDVYHWHPPDTDEVELDAAGRLVHHVSSWANPPNGHFSVEDIAYVYNADGRLQERTLSDATGIYSHSVVTSRDARGLPLAVAIDKQPDEIADQTFPATAHIAGAYGYDELGRLETVQFTFTAANALFYDQTIMYDEAARRRNFVTIVDFSAIDPRSGGPGDNRRYEQLDKDDLLIEIGNTTPGDPTAYIHFRNDEQGRVVSQTYSGGWDPYRVYPLTLSYLYDCQ